MVKIHCLGGCREVGRNAFLIEGEKNIMLDFGFDVSGGTGPVMPKGVKKIDALFVAHGHLDHVGMAPKLYRKYRMPVYMTPPTFDLSNLILRDSIKVGKIKGRPLDFNEVDIMNMNRKYKSVDYGEEVKIGKTKIRIWDAGHIPGSCMFTVQTQGKTIMYTSDFNVNASRLVGGAKFNEKKIDMLIMETTYSSRDHTPRKQAENNLFNAVRNTVKGGGVAVLPSFASRAPELVMIMSAYGADFPVYLDGMGKAATDIAMAHPSFIRNPKALRKAINNMIPLYSMDERKNATKEPAAIITTSGALEGGPVIQYIKKLYANPDNALIFSGFQIPKTAGKYLQDTGRFVHGVMDLKVKMRTEYFDLSGHTGRTDLLEFVQNLRPKKVLCMHGDYTEKFATELKSRFGIPAIAPKNGDIVKL